MNEQPELRWRFKVLDVPKPMKEGTRYRWGFLGSGVACGAMWEFVMVRFFGQERGSTVVFLVAAMLLVWQAIYLRMEHKRIQILTEELRLKMNHHIGPEMTEDEEKRPNGR